MLSTSARLLQLLALLQGPRQWTGPELAERLEVSARTVRHDVDRLRRLGYGVTGVPGVAGGYRLRPGQDLPPLLLDDEEAMAVAIGLLEVAGGSVGSAAEGALRALVKITSSLPTRLRSRLQGLQRASISLTSGRPPVDAETLQEIARACNHHEGIRFDYPSPDGRSTRRVEPYALVHRGGRWYLVAFDRDRDDWRLFRLDRLRLRTPGGPRFTPREIPGGDAGALVVEKLASLADSHPAVLRLHAPLSDVEPWFQDAWGTLEALDERHCLLRSSSESYESLALGVGFSGLDFDVVEPPELRDALATLAARFQRAAQPPEPAGQAAAAP